jgi:hypothetical protein
MAKRGHRAFTMPNVLGDRLRRALRRLVRPFLAPRDPWERTPQRIAVDRFGLGSTRRFEWYFEGDSVVEVESVEEICVWLLGCEYVGDADLFQERDFWQHPRTFEQIRKGDCEDYALWAWRKLRELGVEAELVIGRWARPESSADREHAWVLFRRDGEEYVLEGVARSSERMVRPLSQVRGDYTPHFGVDHRFQTFAFGGYLLADGRRRRRAPRGGRVA